jgi:hypothetical protein
MVKSPGEVRRLERAAQIAEDGVAAVLPMLKAGVTEREAAHVFEAEILRRGASPFFTVITFGERAALADVSPSERARPGRDGPLRPRLRVRGLSLGHRADGRARYGLGQAGPVLRSGPGRGAGGDRGDEAGGAGERDLRARHEGDPRAGDPPLPAKSRGTRHRARALRSAHDQWSHRDAARAGRSSAWRPRTTSTPGVGSRWRTRWRSSRAAPGCSPGRAGSSGSSEARRAPVAARNIAAGIAGAWQHGPPRPRARGVSATTRSPPAGTAS